MTKPAILVNVNRCTGCWTCSVACKVGNKLAPDEWWHNVRTIGSGKGVDNPSGTWPDVHMKWLPFYTSKCSLCAKRTAVGDEPFCSYNCPTRALTYGDMDDPQSPFSIRRKELEDSGFHISQLPEWEASRANIYYAER
jgi:molybdopterin-containing oxidoreductase family iron-sulfur binding subunit